MEIEPEKKSTRNSWKACLSLECEMSKDEKSNVNMRTCNYIEHFLL